MNKLLTLGLILSGLVFAGCATKEQQIVNNPLDIELKSLIKGENLTYDDNQDAIIKALLKHSPSFTQTKQKEALKENIVKLPNNMPLYRQPLFAQMVVFPFVSKNGVYHGYSETWIKIKDGEFVLSDTKKSNKEKIFDYNKVGQ